MQAIVDGEMTDLRQVFQSCFESGTAADLDAAAIAVRKMQFIDKLGREIEALEDQLFDE